MAPYIPPYSIRLSSGSEEGESRKQWHEPTAELDPFETFVILDECS